MLYLPSAILYFIPNRNKGPDPQMLKCLELAGWDSEEQFYLVSGSTARRQQPQTPKDSAKAMDEENTQGEEETSPAHARREEKEVEIPPGERLSVTLVCQAKLVIF